MLFWLSGTLPGSSSDVFLIFLRYNENEDEVCMLNTGELEVVLCGLGF